MTRMASAEELTSSDRLQVFVEALVERCHLQVREITFPPDAELVRHFVAEDRESEWRFEWKRYSPPNGPVWYWALGAVEQFRAECPFVLALLTDGRIVATLDERKGSPVWQRHYWLWNRIDRLCEGQLTRFAEAGGNAAILSWLEDWRRSVVTLRDAGWRVEA